MNPKTERLLRFRLRLGIAPLYLLALVFFGSIAGFILIWVVGYFDRLTR